jgi:CHAT domain-containing protein
MEVRRYHSILDTQTKIEGLYKVPQSEDLTKRELQLKSLLMHQYYLLSIAEQSTSLVKSNEIQARINSLTEKYTNFQDSFKVMSTASLAALSIDPTVHSKLSKDQLIVEYKEVLDAFYAVALTDREIAFVKIPKGTAMDSTLGAFLQALRTPPEIKTFDAEKRKFTLRAHQLYEQLLQPFETLMSNVRFLQVIPDGVLYDFPFYVLLPRVEKGAGYATFQYLGNQLCLSKALSLRLLLQHREQADFRNTGVLAFGSSNQELGLRNVEAELLSIKKYFPVKEYTENFCSSATFVREAADYPILHLALHGKQDSVNYHRSLLLFSKGDTLFAYSLYGLKLNNPLVMLSACESGVGKNREGEGVFSMARAFSMAGASALYVNMWEVPDKSAADLSSFFYEGLATVQQPGEALQFAVMEFIKNRDDYTSHPYFWASTQIITNGRIPTPSSNIGSTGRILAGWLLLSFSLLLVGYLAYLKYATRANTPLG